MITLAPEDSDKTFRVPRVLLTTVTSWFEKALDKRFKEGQDLVLRLPDTNSETVENFLFWLYQRRNPFTKTHPTEVEGSDDQDALREAIILFWAFGDKHFIPAMQGMATITLTRLTAKTKGNWPSLSVIKLGYSVSVAGSPLRRLLSEICIDGIKARLEPTTKTKRRRHERRVTAATTVVVPQGYSLADLEQVDVSPALLIDILKAFVPAPSGEAATSQRDSLAEYLTSVIEGGRETEPLVEL